MPKPATTIPPAGFPELTEAQRDELSSRSASEASHGQLIGERKQLLRMLRDPDSCHELRPREIPSQGRDQSQPEAGDACPRCDAGELVAPPTIAAVRCTHCPFTYSPKERPAP